MLRLEKITGKNVWDILKLCVSEKQKNFVASNDISIIEAYTAITGNGYAFPFGIYEDDTPVGFLMIGFDTDDYWDDAPLIAKGNYNLCKNIQMLAIPGERDGVNAEYCVHDASMCYKLPDNMTTLEGAMIEPLAVGMHGTELSNSYLCHKN